MKKRNEKEYLMGWFPSMQMISVLGFLINWGAAEGVREGFNNKNNNN